MDTQRASRFVALQGTPLRLFIPSDWQLQVEDDHFYGQDASGRVHYEGHSLSIPGLQDFDDMGEMLLAQHVSDACLLQLSGAAVEGKVTVRKLECGAVMYARQGAWKNREVFLQVYLPPTGEGALLTVIHYPAEDRQAMRIALRELRESLLVVE